MNIAIEKLMVVVADGEHARMLVPGSEPGTFRTQRSFDSAEAHLPSHDLGASAPGRTYESVGALRHAITPRSDPHDAAKHAFIAEVAHQVNDAASGGVFDRLVLVAPAHALHDLRDAISSTASERLVGLLQKDLVKMTDEDIGAHLTWDVLHAGLA